MGLRLGTDPEGNVFCSKDIRWGQALIGHKSHSMISWSMKESDIVQLRPFPMSNSVFILLSVIILRGRH